KVNDCGQRAAFIAASGFRQLRENPRRTHVEAPLEDLPRLSDVLRLESFGQLDPGLRRKQLKPLRPLQVVTERIQQHREHDTAGSACNDSKQLEVRVGEMIDVRIDIDPIEQHSQVVIEPLQVVRGSTSRSPVDDLEKHDRHQVQQLDLKLECSFGMRT